MDTLSLHPVGQPQNRQRRDRGVTRASLATMNVVEQMQRAFAPGHRLSGLMGLVLGGFVPVAVYSLVHVEVATHPQFWVMVVGGLAYSAITVFTWARQAFHLTLKALGFVLLLEGAVTFSTQQWLGLAGLVILVVINGVSAAVALQAKE